MHHHCLSIPEILKIIFSYLVLGTDAVDVDVDTGSLFASALVCKAFLNPALDILWENLDSFVPLAKLLPCDLWEERDTLLADDTLRFHRPVTSDDFVAMMPYSRRVRSFMFTDSPRRDHSIDNKAYRALLLASNVFLHGNPLLPGLRSLVIDCYDAEDAWSTQIFLSDKLRKLVIQLPSAETSLPHRAILSVLSVKSPKIEEIYCTQIRVALPVFGTVLSLMVCKMQNLHAVRFPNHALTAAALGHLASLPNLHTIELLAFDMQSAASSAWATKFFVPFAALQCIILIAGDWVTLIKFAEQLIPPQLEIFNAEVDQEPRITSFQLRQLTTYLAARSSASLSRVALRGVCNSSTEDPYGMPVELSTIDIAPLLQCSNLIHLSLSLRCSTVSFDDKFVHSLSKAWPKLRHLNLAAGMKEGGHLTSKCTPISIVHLARNCPNLEWIGLVIDASKRNIWTTEEIFGTCAHKMRHLRVGNAPIQQESVKDMACLLSAVFPGLEHIVAWSGAEVAPHPHARHWREVKEQYDYGVKIREQERAWTYKRQQK
ncbi:hypothetical protein HWV62_15665 [Athelia sp. TMB]|nr:hypothetical protein HWV62_15665 [Athelia sp. TMB]